MFLRKREKGISYRPKIRTVIGGSSWKSEDHFSLQFPRDCFKYRRVPRDPSRALSFRPEEHRPWLYFRGNDQSVNISRVGITGNGDGSYNYTLTGLRKYTKYSVVVKAFNNKGDGPGSDPVTVQTLEDGERTMSRLFILFNFSFMSRTLKFRFDRSNSGIYFTSNLSFHYARLSLISLSVRQ